MPHVLIMPIIQSYTKTLSVCLSFFPFLCICRFVSLSLSLSVSPSLSLIIYLFFLPVSVALSLTLYLLPSLSVCVLLPVFLYLLMYLSLCIAVSPCPFPLSPCICSSLLSLFMWRSHDVCDGSFKPSSCKSCIATCYISLRSLAVPLPCLVILCTDGSFGSLFK